MTLLMVNDEQARLIAGATLPIIVTDASGRQLGKLEPLSPNIAIPPLSREELEELRRRMASPGPGKTTKEVLDRLKSIAPIEH